MKNKYNKMIVMILIGIVVVSAGYMIMKMKYEKSNDISEIQSIVNGYELEYRSKRAFGNDRFDIYSFSLKGNDIEKEFKPYNEYIEKTYTTNFKSLIITKADDDSTLRKIDTAIEKIMRENDKSYKYISVDGTQKLYIYSKELNKVYCLILTI